MWQRCVARRGLGGRGGVVQCHHRASHPAAALHAGTGSDVDFLFRNPEMDYSSIDLVERMVRDAALRFMVELLAGYALSVPRHSSGRVLASHPRSCVRLGRRGVARCHRYRAFLRVPDPDEPFRSLFDADGFIHAEADKHVRKYKVSFCAQVGGGGWSDRVCCTC